MTLAHSSILNGSSGAGTKLEETIFTDLNSLLGNDVGLDTDITTVEGGYTTLNGQIMYKSCTSCSGSCSTTCTGNCLQYCTTTCGGNCTGGCSGTCTGGCNTACNGG